MVSTLLPGSLAGAIKAPESGCPIGLWEPRSVAGERLRAGRIFINVGGRALAAPMPGINEVPYLTNSSMMDFDFLPRHLIIVGGSYIGLDGCCRVQAATAAVIFI
jgi:pyruvate/2-oxoglutarate dehydrogenase complex dihydrolipoamide dehydrogenase (E3) component